MISSTTGAIINKYEYNPFGALAVNDETVDNPFKFSSEYNEKETGLVYYNYRFYDPSTGKWLSRDPIQEKGGFILYGYIGNNPINDVDNLGLWSLSFSVNKSINLPKGYFATISAKAYLDEGAGIVSIAASGGAKAEFTDFMNPLASMIIAPLLTKLGIKQEIRAGLTGQAAVSCSCKGKYVICSLVKFGFALSIQGRVGFQNENYRFLLTIAAGLKWNVLTGHLGGYASIGVRAQWKSWFGSWAGYNYSKSASANTIAQFTPWGEQQFALKLSKSCGCMEGNVDGSQLLGEMFD